MTDHTSTGEGNVPHITVIVAPNAGRLKMLPPRRFQAGSEWLEAGQEVAVIERGVERDLVLSPARGRLGGVLGRDGEPVKAGQALAWMVPA